MDTNTVQVINSVGNKLDQYINVLSSKIGVATDHFYPIFVRQQQIEGIFTLVMLLIGTVIAITMLRMGIKYSKHAYDDNKSENIKILGFIVGAVIAIAVCGFLIEGSFISKIFNPEYHAFQNLVNMIK